MPPKPINSNPRIINQYPIIIPTHAINNNDGSKFTKTIEKDKDISKPVNSFLNMIQNNLIIVGGTIIGVVFIVLRKK